MLYSILFTLCMFFSYSDVNLMWLQKAATSPFIHVLCDVGSLEDLPQNMQISKVLEFSSDVWWLVNAYSGLIIIETFQQCQWLFEKMLIIHSYCNCSVYNSIWNWLIFSFHTLFILTASSMCSYFSKYRYVRYL